jgi:hypothetical protein
MLNVSSAVPAIAIAGTFQPSARASWSAGHA